MSRLQSKPPFQIPLERIPAHHCDMSVNPRLARPSLNPWLLELAPSCFHASNNHSILLIQPVRLDQTTLFPTIRALYRWHFFLKLSLTPTPSFLWPVPCLRVALFLRACAPTFLGRLAIVCCGAVHYQSLGGDIFCYLAFSGPQSAGYRALIISVPEHRTVCSAETLYVSVGVEMQMANPMVNLQV